MGEKWECFKHKFSLPYAEAYAKISQIFFYRAVCRLIRFNQTHHPAMLHNGKKVGIGRKALFLA
jgi:hypothetical protein